MALKPFSLPPKTKLAPISFHNNKLGWKIFKHIKKKQQTFRKEFQKLVA